MIRSVMIQYFFMIVLAFLLAETLRKELPLWQKISLLAILIFGFIINA